MSGPHTIIGPHIIGQYTLGAGSLRTEQPTPNYRLARRSGELVLQRAYQWQQGSTGGLEWRDEPIVDLDAVAQVLR
jgi:hypothetical protein